MKKIVFLLFLISASIQAQYKIKGELNPPKKYTWVILYKIEGARQVFVKSSSIKKASKTIKGKKTTVGKFTFDLPANAKPGSYRVSYNVNPPRFADFIFNKENISFIFNPEKAEETISFSKSEENKMYIEYTNTVSTMQYKTDSLQVAYLKNPSSASANLYKRQLKKIQELQKLYIKKSKGKLVGNFIKATNRYNSPVIAKSSQEYLNSVITHFFDNIDFNNKALYNSSFLIDRITDYVFYMNYSDNAETQDKLHKKAVSVVLNKAKNNAFKKDILEFLITQFVNYKKIDFADYLFSAYYNKLPKNSQNADFKKSYNEKTMVAVGRTAPEIIWKENGKNYKLSTINEAKNYVLIFWSTGCGHCTRELPQLHKFSKKIKNTKVIAYSLENNEKDWKNYIPKLKDWHHVVGLKKWENEIARTYQIYSTPTYIVLNSKKKIIAKPKTLQELEKIMTYLE